MNENQSIFEKFVRFLATDSSDDDLYDFCSNFGFEMPMYEILDTVYYPDIEGIAKRIVEIADD